jgi:hypothetical protein
VKPPPSLLFLALAGMLSTCTGCVDLPGPVPDGQLFRCTMTNPRTGELTGVTFTCASWDDWYTAAETCSEAWPGNNVNATGTRQVCIYDGGEGG